MRRTVFVLLLLVVAVMVLAAGPQVRLPAQEAHKPRPGQGAAQDATSLTEVGVGSPQPSPGQASDETQVRVPGDPQHAENLARAVLEGLDYVPGEVVVKFREGLPEGGEQRVLASALVLRQPPKLKWVGDAALLYLEAGMDAVTTAATLAEDPAVEYAEPNFRHRLHWRPNDPDYSAQWNFQALDMERVWDINRGGSRDVIVAVIDSGLAYKNGSALFYYWTGRVFARVSVPFAAADDLVTDDRVVSPWDFFWDDDTPVDMDGHGTHVAGTIGQLTDNGIGNAGMAAGVRIMPLKVCYGHWDLQFWYGAQGVRRFFEPDDSGCTTVDTARAIRFAADHGADVINLSLGGPQATNVVREALTYAVQKGVFIAAAMGNEFEQGSPLHYPAAFAPELEGMVSVGALGRGLTRAFYSSVGPHLELVAPGGDYRRDGSAGLIYQQTLDPGFFNYPAALLRVPRFDRLSHNLPYYQGTSMATPHVAGAAALLISQGITRPSAVETVLKRTARDLGPEGFDEEYGYGLIQPRSALRGLGWAR